MVLREIRNKFNLSQLEASKIVNVPLRTYIRYENDDQYGDELKRQRMMELILSNCEITETKGILTIEQIISIVTELFNSEYQNEVEYCYLFGSYAKGYAKDSSDVDLFVSTSLTGLNFVGLIEKLRQALHKKVDLIRLSELNNNVALLNEIMKDGIRIYEQQQNQLILHGKSTK